MGGLLPSSAYNARVADLFPVIRRQMGRSPHPSRRRSDRGAGGCPTPPARTRRNVVCYAAERTGTTPDTGTSIGSGNIEVERITVT